MKKTLFGVVAAIGVLAGTVGSAAPVTLTPANPQPSGLKTGLSVVYGYGENGEDLKTLKDARDLLQSAQSGQPLRGLDYRDTDPGDPTLTSKQAEQVAAYITGYVRFDAPGTYVIDFYTNDGLSAQIGGKRVGHFDGRQACDSTFQKTVNVPQAGWYDFKATYFNRLNTSCLMMRWAPKGQKMKWTENAAFGYK